MRALILATAILTVACGEGGGTASPCANGVLDEGETALDCGGACGLCPGAECVEPSSCASRRCVGGFCAVGTCDDGIHNGAERGVDCGGPCAPCGGTSEPDVHVADSSAPDTVAASPDSFGPSPDTVGPSPDTVGPTPDTGGAPEDTAAQPDDTTSPGEDIVPDTTTSTGSAPVILSLLTNHTVLSPEHPSRSVLITAVVSDPDGIDDVIGGVLVGDGATYGAFATAAAEGAYEISVSFDDLENITPFVSTPAGGTKRWLTAEFFDVAGHKTTGQVEISISCEDDTAGICEGECHDFYWATSYCGGCHTPVASTDECTAGVLECQLEVDPMPSEDVFDVVSYSLAYYSSGSCGFGEPNIPVAQAYRYTATAAETLTVELAWLTDTPTMDFYLRADTGTCAGAILVCAAIDPFGPDEAEIELAAGQTIVVSFTSRVTDPSEPIPFRIKLYHDYE